MFITDTGANRIIVNNTGLLTDLSVSNAKIKGIGGKGIEISHTGKPIIPLKSDSSDLGIVSDLNAVLVPSCPMI